MYGKNHYNIVISLQLIKINEKKKKRKKIYCELWNYYSKNPVDGSLSLLKLKLLPEYAVGFAIPAERVAGNS